MLLISAELETITTRRDKSWKLVFGTLELSPDQVAELARAQNKAVFIAMKIDAFKQEEQEILNSLDTEYEDTRKSQSQRIRSVLFLLWRQSNEGYKAFIDYYNMQTDKIIEHFKRKIQ